MSCHNTLSEPPVYKRQTSQICFINFNEKLRIIYHLLMLALNRSLKDGKWKSCGRWEGSAISLFIFCCFYSNWQFDHHTSGFISGTLTLLSVSIPKTKTGPVSVFVVWENLGFGVSAFGSETSQQGLFVFWISDYSNACQIAFCFMPMHAATSEGKVPLYWEPSDKWWRLWFSVLSKSGASLLKVSWNYFWIRLKTVWCKKKV